MDFKQIQDNKFLVTEIYEAINFLWINKLPFLIFFSPVCVIMNI